jgi:hypothetical protein
MLQIAMTADQLSGHYNDVARRLVKAHLALKEEPLLLAARLPSRNSKDLVLLEVIENFPGASDDELFVTEMSSSHDVPILGKLKMILGSAEQLEAALKRRDKSISSRSSKGGSGVVLFPPKSKRNAKLKELITALRLDG